MTLPKRDASTLDALLDETLARAPYDLAAQDTWLFVYGAMLQDPPFPAEERQTARLDGFRRRFCLADPLLRGTEARPGLTLGLEPGGDCLGLAWRLDRRRLRDRIGSFWPQEMALPLYCPAWRPVLVGGAAAPALVLLADPLGPLFETGADDGAVAERIAAASGARGRNADYLYEAAGALDRAGIPDPYLERLAAQVRARSRAQA